MWGAASSLFRRRETTTRRKPRSRRLSPPTQEEKRARGSLEAHREQDQGLKLAAKLISRAQGSKQAAFLSISLRQHLLSIALQQSAELLEIDDQRETQRKLERIIREKLDTSRTFRNA